MRSLDEFVVGVGERTGSVRDDPVRVDGVTVETDEDIQHLKELSIDDVTDYGSLR